MKGIEKDITTIYEHVNRAVVLIEDCDVPDEALDALFAALGILRDVQETCDLTEDLDFDKSVQRSWDDDEQE